MTVNANKHYVVRKAFSNISHRFAIFTIPYREIKYIFKQVVVATQTQLFAVVEMSHDFKQLFDCVVVKIYGKANRTANAILLLAFFRVNIVIRKIVHNSSPIK
jgi:hypothetical protein